MVFCNLVSLQLILPLFVKGFFQTTNTGYYLIKGVMNKLKKVLVQKTED